MIDTDVFLKLYERFGKDIKFKVLTEKAEKVVYEIETKEGVFILIVLPDLSGVQFFKYMVSQGLQQHLYEKGFPVAKVVYAYIVGKTVVVVHEKLSGSNMFEHTPENMEKMGEIAGRLHRFTASDEYKKIRLLFPYPNKVVHATLMFKEFCRRHISYWFKYFHLRSMPAGICHRDFNKRNVFIDSSGHMGLIDFDVYRYQPFVEGLVRFYNRKITDKSFMGAFMKGYEKERPLTEAEKKYLKKFF